VAWDDQGTSLAWLRLYHRDGAPAGRDDPCGFFHNSFRCDTAHNGFGGDAILTVNGPGRPLIGNVDGL